MKIYSLFLLTFFLPFGVLGQTETTITGKIQDQKTKEALPYVSIGFKGIGGGTTSDFEGRFKITTKQPVDTLIVTYVGYIPYKIKVKRGEVQKLLIELQEQTFEMPEAVIRPGINPALRIIDAARENKKIVNQDQIEAYQYNSYSKVDISLTNISEEMKNSKVFKPLKSLFDTIHQMRNLDGKHILPVFVSETFSKYYYLKSIGKGKEVIEGSKYSGIGIEANSYLMDLMGGQLHHYNLNQNFVRILNKDFVSPVGDAAHFYYIFSLLDSVAIDGVKCYKIQLNLRRKQDLGFEGFIWITDSSFALKQVDLSIGKEANVNFVQRIKVQQEMQATPSKAWITSKSRIIFDFERIQKNGSGMVAGFYNAYTDINTDVSFNKEFFDYPIVTLENTANKDSSYWEEKRTEPLSSIEKEMFNKVDSVNNLPVVKTYVDLIHTAIEGYKRIGKLDWGPYMNVLAFNKVEGTRLRLGFKTNYDFSQKFVFNTYLAYGLLDQEFKYKLGVDYIIDSRRWTVASARYRKDNDILGITNSPISYALANGFFQFFNFFSPNIRINRTEEVNLSFTQTFSSNWTIKFLFDHQQFRPLGDFAFAYNTSVTNPGEMPQVKSNYINCNVGIEARWAYKEIMISRGHDRFRVERAKLPVLIFSYHRGLKGLAGSNFEYDKFNLIISHHMNTAWAGTADWYIYTGKIFGPLPYPLLDVARGNESFIYSDYNYSLMNNYEFVSDVFIHSTYTQHFEGALFNHIPWVNKLKLRNFATLKAAYGAISNTNLKANASLTADGKSTSPIYTFSNYEPYFELGYGIENIFKVASFGFVHRLNYHDHQNVRKFGINLGINLLF